MKSEATNPEAYLAALPADRRQTVEAVRAVILRNLPDGYRESMNWGMLSYEIPLERYADTYNGKPLGYIGLASQKNHLSLYLMGAYAVPGVAQTLERRFREAGRKWDMGKSCLRFRRIDDLELDALADAIRAVPVDRYIEFYEASRSGSPKKPAKTSTGASRTTRKEAAGKQAPSSKSPTKKVASKRGSTRAT
jgi:hypothetical protein